MSLITNWEEVAFSLRENAGKLIIALEDITGDSRLDIEKDIENLQEACDIYDELYGDSLND